MRIILIDDEKVDDDDDDDELQPRGKERIRKCEALHFRD